MQWKTTGDVRKEVANLYALASQGKLSPEEVRARSIPFKHYLKVIALEVEVARLRKEPLGKELPNIKLAD